ncbi:MAG: tetratricopeptide repeat protein [Candidatus Poribacteria bacterium]|nr:tetratricopeptide repeat protein [Candidatus Poribacteria bacterium]
MTKAGKLAFAFYVLSFTFGGNLHLYAQSQSTLEASYRRANAAYADGQYQQAIEKYEQIAASLPSGIVYYNLGNAYFRLGKRGKAILNYERAKRLIPRDKDTIFNLKVAKAQNIDQFDLVKPLSGFSLLYGALHPDEIAWFGLVPYWIAALSIVWLQFSQNRPLRRVLRYIAPVGCLAWLFSLLLVSLKVHELIVPYAIVTVDEIAVRSTPDSGAEAIALPLHEGTKIQIHEERRDWVKIYLPEENAGWLPADGIERI